jgi:hypothetical protein
MVVFYAVFISFIFFILKCLMKLSTSCCFGFIAVSDLLIKQMGQLRLLLICTLVCVAFFLFGQLVSGHLILNLNILVEFNLLIITLYHIMKDPYNPHVLSKSKFNFKENTGGLLCLRIFSGNSIQRKPITI